MQPLSEKHLALQRMVNGGNMLFVDNEKWRKGNVPERMKLPRFIQREESHPVKNQVFQLQLYTGRISTLPVRKLFTSSINTSFR